MDQFRLSTGRFHFRNTALKRVLINCSPLISSIHQRLQRFLVVSVAEQTGMSLYIVTYLVKISKDCVFSSHEPHDC